MTLDRWHLNGWQSNDRCCLGRWPLGSGLFGLLQTGLPLSFMLVWPIRQQSIMSSMAWMVGFSFHSLESGILEGGVLSHQVWPGWKWLGMCSLKDSMSLFHGLNGVILDRATKTATWKAQHRRRWPVQLWFGLLAHWKLGRASVVRIVMCT